LITFDGTLVGDTFTISQNYQWGAGWRYSDLAVLPDESFYVVWCGDECLMQHFDPYGDLVGDIIYVTQNTIGMFPTIAIQGYSGIVAWTDDSGMDSSGQGIYARYFQGTFY